MVFNYVSASVRVCRTSSSRPGLKGLSSPASCRNCKNLGSELFRFYDVYLHGVLDEEEARYVGRKTHETLMEKKYGTEADLTDDERAAIERQD